LHRAFDEINGLFHVDLCFVFGHHACGRQLFGGDVGAEQHNHRSILLSQDGGLPFPVQFPGLVFVAAGQGDMEVCLGMGLLQGLVIRD